VGKLFVDLLGGRPFTVFSHKHPTMHPRVLRLSPGEQAMAVHHDAASLVLDTTSGDVELGFALSRRHADVTYQFVQGQLLIHYVRDDTVTVRREHQVVGAP